MNMQLVSAKRLLETEFEEESRPSLRWLREMTKRRAIPSVKIGHLVFYSPAHVRDAVERKLTLKAKNELAKVTPVPQASSRRGK